MPKASLTHNLEFLNSSLSEEWHPSKNGVLTPKDVAPNSNRKVWWKCKKKHEWEASVNSRNKGSGCPYCSGRLATSKNNLQVINPKLAKEWHPTKNGNLTPKDVTPGSNKKVWWICKNHHVWIADVYHRNKGSGCPFCSGNLACEDNCLANSNPSIAKEWHPNKNGILTPKNVTPGSDRKVWWLCKNGHEWKSKINNRVHGRNCPYCVGKKAYAGNCLKTLNPALAKEWHTLKNKKLTSEDVTPGSSKSVWWICEKGHEWKAIISNRNKGSGCPYCSGRLATKDYNLQIIFPELTLEWHHSKNGALLPKDFTPGSPKKVWWICKKGHEWKTSISHRSRGSGCPYCSGNKVCIDNCLETLNPNLAKEWHPVKNQDLTPKDVTIGSDKKVWWLCNRDHEWEASIYKRNEGKGCPYCYSQTSQLELRIYSEFKYLFGNVVHRKKFNNFECDIYLPDLRAGVEIDSYYWHKDRFKNENIKSRFFVKQNVLLLRLREKGLKRISKNDIFYTDKDIEFALIKQLIKKLIKLFLIDKDAVAELKNYLAKGKFTNTKEYKRLLFMLPSPISENSLQEFNSALSKEWHPTKNGNLTPKDVTPFSNKKVWWKCANSHEWKASVANRNQGRGCPYCAGKFVCDDNCLETINPMLSKQWHPNKNGKLTPRDVTSGSDKKVWWTCKKGHEFQATIGNRHRGSGCPICYGRKN